jgi:hypothetical protein
MQNHLSALCLPPHHCAAASEEDFLDRGKEDLPQAREFDDH